MKAQVQSFKNVRVGGVSDGKVHKINQREKEDKTVEIKKYLHQIEEVVPFLPKTKRLSKLEVISNVIDYIHDLRDTLGLSACTATFYSEIPLKPNTNNNNANISSLIRFSHYPNFVVCIQPNYHKCHRQPLCVVSNPRRTQ